MEPRTPRDVKPVTLVRKAHRVIGVAMSLFVSALAVTGLVLIHQKDWTWLKDVEVPSSLIPGWTATVMVQKGSQVKSLAVGHKPDSPEPEIATAVKAGLFVQKAGQWSAVGPAVKQPEVTALLITDSRWLIGTQQGLFTSEDAGETWEANGRTTDGAMPTGKITMILRSPSHPDILYLGSKSGAYVSKDSGRRWAALAGETGASSGLATEITVISFDPSQADYVFLGTKRGVYRYNQRSGAVETVNLDLLEALIAAKPMKMTLDVYLNDLHTGKLFADNLWPLYDLTAAALVLFVGTGLYMWSYPLLKRRESGLRKNRLPDNSSSSPITRDRGPTRAVER